MSGNAEPEVGRTKVVAQGLAMLSRLGLASIYATGPPSIQGRVYVEVSRSLKGSYGGRDCVPSVLSGASGHKPPGMQVDRYRLRYSNNGSRNVMATCTTFVQ